ncbi:hypothetical protein RRG08_066398 [Elysia crispata]|uniref:Secreted protein n=1 Tax=Elysia crispata TaxID=231223 RepID=A0AAE0YU49_9GAST|nr:hypothetical protein RRG08_066398 [Elysia crispata]
MIAAHWAVVWTLIAVGARSYDRCPLGGGLDINCCWGAFVSSMHRVFSCLLWPRTKEMGSICSRENLFTAIHSIVKKLCFCSGHLSRLKKKTAFLTSLFATSCKTPYMHDVISLEPLPADPSCHTLQVAFVELYSYQLKS